MGALLVCRRPAVSMMAMSMRSRAARSTVWKATGCGVLALLLRAHDRRSPRSAQVAEAAPTAAAPRKVSAAPTTTGAAVVGSGTSRTSRSWSFRRRRWLGRRAPPPGRAVRCRVRSSFGEALLEGLAQHPLQVGAGRSCGTSRRSAAQLVDDRVGEVGTEVGARSERPRGRPTSRRRSSCARTSRAARRRATMPQPCPKGRRHGATLAA